MGKRVWLYGTTEKGYAYRKLDRKRYPWQTQVWLDGRIMRTDNFETKKIAIQYIKDRRRHIGGRKGYPKR